MKMTADLRQLTQKATIAVFTALVTLLLTFASNGFNAISHAEAEAMIQAEETHRETKIDLVLQRLTAIEITQARLEEKINAMREENKRDKEH